MLMLNIRGCKKLAMYDLVLKIETFIVNYNFANTSKSAIDLNLQLKDDDLVKISTFYLFANFLHKFLRLSI